MLLQRKLLVTALEVNSPEINVTRSSGGQVDLTDVLRESSSDSESNNSFAFAVSNVEIKGGEIRLTDTQQKIELELPNIDVTLDGTLQNWDHTGSLSIGKGVSNLMEQRCQLSGWIIFSFMCQRLKVIWKDYN